MKQLKSVPPDKRIVDEFEARYRAVLDVAKGEYEYEPPGKYYKEGYNLYLRLDNFMCNHLLFLHNPNIPADNNLSERLLRNYKRKQKQVMAFRSFISLTHLCRSMSVIASSRANNENLYANAASIFN